MERRTFLKNSLAGSVFFLPGWGEKLWADNWSVINGFPYGVLGRTGEKVSLLGIGGWQAGTDVVSQDMLNGMIDRALEIGVNYIDTSPNYGNSEEKLGIALEGKREHFFIATKTQESTYDGAWRLLEQSLKRLKTDHLEVVQFHSIGNLSRFPDLEAIFSANGAIKALQEAREQKVIKYIGATGHNYPSRFHQLMDSGMFDTLLTVVNYVVQHSYDFEHKVWNRAVKQDLGLVAMKVLGGGDPKPAGMRLPHDTYDDCIRYALSLPGISTMVIGMENQEELERAAQAVKDLTPLSDVEFRMLYAKGLEILQQDSQWYTPYGEPVN
jgi:uncharacterized protein